MPRTIRIYDKDFQEVGTFPEDEYMVEVTPGNCLIFRNKIGKNSFLEWITSLDSIWSPERWDTVDVTED